MTVQATAKAAQSAADDLDDDQDLLAGTGAGDDEDQDDELEQETTQDDEADGSGEDDEDDSQAAPVDIKEQVSTIKETVQQKTEQIESFREENVFLSQQITNPDKEQFEKGGIYEGLPEYTLGNVSLYRATPEQVEGAIYQIENSDLSATEKRALIRKIDNSLAVFQDRQKQYEKQIKQNLDNANIQEWQQVELGFKDPETGIKGIEKHIPEIWDWCKTQMNGSRALKAKCEASFQAKFDLAVRAIRELGIDKKLSKSLSGKERDGLPAPVGQGGSKGKRGTSQGRTFTRAQLAEFNKNPSKVSEKLMAEIESAVANGRIKDK